MTNETGPQDDELEVSVFGPGVGESILVHCGNQRWIIIDSCRDSRTGDIAPLIYLKSLGLDPATCVDWVVATHAHDDHIDGLGDVVSACEQARVALPAASSVEEFFAIERFDARLDFYNTRWRIYSEFERVLTELETSHRDLTYLYFVSAGKVLPFESVASDYVGPSLTFVAPSDYAVLQSKRVFGRLLQRAVDQTNAGRIASRDPNSFSSAVLVRCLEHVVLLGGDVKNGSTSWGWTHVVNSFPVVRQVDIFKVAHHGDPKSHHPTIWDDWLHEDSVAIVSPYRPAGRPRDGDIERMRQTGRQVWVTARPGSIPDSRDVRLAAAKLRRVARDVEEVSGMVGQVRYRRSARNGTTVQPFGPARQVC